MLMRPADYAAFARALCEPAAPLPAGLRTAPGAALQQRFDVYRNNVHASLIAALGESFPVTRALVGDEFFRAMAHGYVRTRKPHGPVLALYGDTFPDFIDGHAPAATLPFLGDVARLERAWSASWSAADEPALDRAALARYAARQLADARIRAHAAAHLVRSRWPVAALWEAHRAAVPDLSRLTWQPEHVLVTRPDAEIRLLRLAPGAADIAASLLAGNPISVAAAEDPLTDIGAALGLYIDCGMIAEILPS
jgi:hypothetical protein